MDAVKELCKDLNRPIERTGFYICNGPVVMLKGNEFKTHPGVRALTAMTKTLHEVTNIYSRMMS